MTEGHRTRHSRRLGKAIFLAVGILIGGALLLHWSWNTLVTGPFKLPDIEFRHALALELLLSALYLIPNTVSHIFASPHKP